MMPVYLSQTAYDQLHQILDYLEEKWSAQVSDNFLNKLERTMDSIGQFPYSSPPASHFPGLRKCVINKQVSAFYRIDEVRKEVEILAVLDNRQDFSF
ncbi:MAG: type II toxin-antitoxin system RelE/ParE family toxin [Saprospiraceae bacterium]|nr:type II toxin-antitoxin system RelE/ParE family toxin [Saprospiraceae bacterium]MCF8248676.1 type II toxin-antitoxin system RelE/ParE family toxin [Saprospiraceae bacterium]MCF8278834.1 type II toxin-antitoxin system RelE/ParE family toxin [Bacteroidales bacterium]MCF8310634.1 type II toxin-antitoxin system RelE/ParE family toxin [Saprospiraceae bacterium]MCF8439193.1 type II toxin-antitoxin system RelE/ParE family toxin [Saprospiraceae bacterium]